MDRLERHGDCYGEQKTISGEEFLPGLADFGNAQHLLSYLSAVYQFFEIYGYAAGGRSMVYRLVRASFSGPGETGREAAAQP